MPSCLISNPARRAISRQDFLEVRKKENTLATANMTQPGTHTIKRNRPPGFRTRTYLTETPLLVGAEVVHHVGADGAVKCAVGERQRGDVTFLDRDAIGDPGDAQVALQQRPASFLDIFRVEAIERHDPGMPVRPGEGDGSPAGAAARVENRIPVVGQEVDHRQHDVVDPLGGAKEDVAREEVGRQEQK